jgi:cytochrome c
MMVRRLQAPALSAFFLSLVAILYSISPATGDDAAAGAGVFIKRCSGCHALDSDKEGPRLRGVVGRKAGTVPAFQYSDSLRDSGVVWNEDLLGKWLENTESVVKNNDMEFRVSNAAERQAVIAYLKSSAK